MCKEPINRLFLFYIPNTDTLIVGTTGHKFTIITNNQIPNPFLMSFEGTFIKSRANFPKLNCHIPTCRYQKITIQYKINIAYIMIMSIKCFTTLIVVV